MSTSNPLSRIARQLTLRRAELTAHTASVVAWTLTALLVGAGYAEEANPFSAFLIAQSSVHAWALVTPLLVAGLFAGLRWVRDHDDPRAALAGGWVVAAALVVDAAGNVFGTAVVGLPTVQLLEFGGFVAALVGLAAVCVARPSPSTLHLRTLDPLTDRVRVVDFRKAFAITVVLMVVISGVPFSAANFTTSLVGSATADASDSTILDDVEDNDENIEASGWDGYYYVNGDSLSPTTSDAISGTYSQKLSNSDLVKRAYLNNTNNVTDSRIALRASVLSEDGDTNDNMDIRMKSGGTEFVHIEFEAGSRDLKVNGNKVQDYTLKTVYDIELTSISYTNNNFDLWINHEKVGTYNFSSDVDGLQSMWFESDSNVNGGTNTLVFDDIQLGGTRYDFPPATKDIDGDFEDGNLSVNNDGWSGWNEIYPSVSVTSTEPISGNNSMLISPSDNVARAQLESNGEDVQHSAFQARMRPMGDNGATNDNHDMLVKDDGNSIFGIQFQQGSKDIRMWTGSGMVDIGQNWKPGHVYNVSARNVSWSENKWTAYINGKKIGRYTFYTNSPDYDSIVFQTDANAAGGDPDMRVDDISIEGPKFQTYGISEKYVSFENQPADSGAPDGYTLDGAGTVDFLNVTTLRAYEGTQSLYWGESVDGANLELYNNSEPYARDHTSDISIAIFKTDNDSDPNANDWTSIAVKEDEKTAIDIGIDNKGILKTHDGTSYTELANVGTGKWVKITITDIDPKNKTYSIKYDNGTDTGKFINQDFRNDADGYDQIELKTDENGFMDALRFGPRGGTSGSAQVSGRVVSCPGSNPDCDSDTVANQNSQPVSNATVEVIGVDYSQISASGAQTLEERADELIDEAQNPKPTSWDPNRALTGSSGFYANTDAEYVAVHNKADWGLAKWADEPQLGEPRLQVPADQEVALSVWDASGGGLVQDGVNSDLPGAVVDDRDIVIETLAASGESIGTTTLSTSTTYDVSFPGGEHDLSTTTLPAGFYRVYPKGSPGQAIVIVAGDPTEIVSAITSDLKSEAGTLTNRAQSIRDNFDQGKFTSTTVTTNENGEWSASVGSNVETVAVQAYKRPPGLSTDAANLEIADIRTYYETTQYEGSYILPSSPTRADVPNSGVTVRVREFAAPQYGDLGRYQNLAAALDDLLANTNLDETVAALQQRLDSETTTRLRETYRSIRTLAENNEKVRDRASDYLGDGESLLRPADELSDAELRQRINAIERAITTTRATVGTDSAETALGDGTVTARFPFDTGVSRDQITIFAHYSNGTTVPINASSEYVTVKGGISPLGGDTVVISEFPVGSSDPAAVRFSVRAATDEGLAKASTTVSNPSSGAEPPGLSSIRVDSLRPGPDETVGFELRGTDDSTITNITTVEAFGPDGSTVTTSVTGKRTGSLATNGKGVHMARVTFETADGQTGTVTVRLAASNVDRKLPPGIQVRESPFGTFALVGDGFEAGDVEVEPGGSRITVTGQIPEDGEAPNTVHVYTSAVSLPSDSVVNIRVVRGADGQAVTKHVPVSVHMSAFELAESTAYRGGDAIPLPGGNSAGNVTVNGSEVLVDTYTDENGELTLSTNTNPGIVDRVRYRVDLFVGQIEVPSTGLGVAAVPPLPTTPVDTAGGLSSLAALFVVPAGIRRWGVRKTATVAVVALVVSAGTVAPVAAASDDGEPSITRYNSEPSYAVTLADNSTDEVRNWAESSDTRTLVRVSTVSDTATVAAPYLDVMGGLVGFGPDGLEVGLSAGDSLSELAYVEAIRPNYQQSIVRPVGRITTREDVPTPETIGLLGYDDPERPTEGIAFSNDSSPTTMSETAGLLGVSNISASTSGMTVAVVDTGVNTADGRVFGNGSAGSAVRIDNASASFLGGEAETVENNSLDVLEDRNGHGTWTASAIAANASGTTHDGMAPNASLLVLKALDGEGQGPTSNIAASVRYAADQNASVISLSLGSPIYDEGIADAVAYAHDQGSVVVVAAGNSRWTRSPGLATPADVKGAIAVGASNYSGQGADALGSAAFSQAGPDPSTTDGAGTESAGAEVDVVAPGMQQRVRAPNTDGYVSNSTLSGTSMATPEVAGGLLVAMAANDSLASATPDEVEDAVQDSARPAKRLAAAEAGHGLFAADNLATGTHPETSQADSMTDPASQRDEYYRAASDAAGGVLASAARRVGVGA
ncbi:S8 family serine peptidase [Halolamina sp.]|uniref:S8 family peptidase n=1 Tax=Halolamina sp. TaxID=1940283 RepID=UPI0035624DE5